MVEQAWYELGYKAGTARVQFDKRYENGIVNGVLLFAEANEELDVDWTMPDKDYRRFEYVRGYIAAYEKEWNL